MIHVIAEIELRAGARGEFLQAFRELVPKVRAEAGCIEYGPAIDLGAEMTSPPRENVVTVIEKWESLPALRDHLAAPHMADFREQTSSLAASISIRVLEPA